jgi:hypothetical protein
MVKRAAIADNDPVEVPMAGPQQMLPGPIEDRLKEHVGWRLLRCRRVMVRDFLR